MCVFCAGSATPRPTRWPVLYLLVVTYHVIMAPGNLRNCYQHRAVRPELNIELQHHGNNSGVCTPHRGPHNVSTGRDKGESVRVMEKKKKTLLLFCSAACFIMCGNLKVDLYRIHKKEQHLLLESLHLFRFLNEFKDSVPLM